MEFRDKRGCSVRRGSHRVINVVVVSDGALLAA